MIAPRQAVLLPERRRFAGQPIAKVMARALGRADRLADRAAGEQAQLQRWFELLPRGWPMAAITRQRDAGDAALHSWLRADPAYVRPDMTGARVLAIGELGLSADEAQALARALGPVFGDAGFPLSAPHPARWYLAMPVEARLPAFAAPESMLGDDLFLHLPEGPEGRRWRALLNEAQIILHNHPVNAARVAAGRVPANSLCFWGAGRLPDQVRASLPNVQSTESQLASLAALATAGTNGQDGDLLDLRDARDWSLVESALLPRLPSLDAHGMLLDFADGAAWQLRSGQGWRLWRPALATLE